MIFNSLFRRRLPAAGLLIGLALLAMNNGVVLAQAPVEKNPGLEPRQILILGDSLAAGYGLDASEGFPALLQKKIEARGWNFNVVNAGVSGDTSAGGLRRLDWLLRRPVHVLIVELGGNDGLRGIEPEATRTNLQAIIDRTRQRYPAVHTVIAGMKMPPNMGPDYRERFERIFPELARRNNAAFVPFLLEGVGGRPELNLPDRIHPNVEGHRLVAETVWTTLEPVLEKLSLTPSHPAPPAAPAAASKKF
jgi:acyl-CoA thioesterase-1